jgi:hypothetical protein
VYFILILSAHICLGRPCSHLFSSTCCAPSVYFDLSPWSRMFLDTLVVAHPLSTFFIFYIIKGSLPCSQQPFVGPCPEPHEYSPQPPIGFLIFVAILSSHQTLRSFKKYFPFMFLIEIVNAFLIYPLRATFHSHLIFSDKITLIIFSKDHNLCSSSFCNFFIFFCLVILLKKVKSSCLMNQAP